MVLPMQKRFSVFNKVYLVNHFHDILDYSYKWLVFKTFIGRPVKSPAFGTHIPFSHAGNQISRSHDSTRFFMLHNIFPPIFLPHATFINKYFPISIMTETFRNSNTVNFRVVTYF